MIKDNTATRIILGIALVAIWGLVIYRIVDAMKGKDTPNIAPIAYWLDSTNTNTNETFQLHLGYNDPFLKTVSLSSNYQIDNNSDSEYSPQTIEQNPVNPPTEVSGQATSIANLLPQAPKKIQFPQMKYVGFVANKQNGKSLAIIKHNNKTYRVRVGDKVANCSVISIERDSVQVTLKGQVQSVLR